MKRSSADPMGPSLRRLALTAHVASSVAWLGAVASFLALALVGQLTANDLVARAAYVAMDIVGWLVVVPFAFLSLVTGVLQSLGTHWGLFRHYWVAIKLFLTVFATVLLLLHMHPTGQVAEAAAGSDPSYSTLYSLRLQLIADATAGFATLLYATVLSIYKPKGVTPLGRQRADDAE
jgi:hypothetical protein